MKRYNVGVIGRHGNGRPTFLLILQNHPLFEVAALAASGRSAGKTYAEAVAGKWAFGCPVPEKYAGLTGTRRRKRRR